MKASQFKITQVQGVAFLATVTLLCNAPVFAQDKIVPKDPPAPTPKASVKKDFFSIIDLKASDINHTNPVAPRDASGDGVDLKDISTFDAIEAPSSGTPKNGRPLEKDVEKPSKDERVRVSSKPNVSENKSAPVTSPKKPAPHGDIIYPAPAKSLTKSSAPIQDPPAPAAPSKSQVGAQAAQSSSSSSAPQTKASRPKPLLKRLFDF